MSKLTDAQKVTADQHRPAEESDWELIASYLAGSEEAFNRLVMRHQRTTINLAYRFLGDYDDACDIAQEAFLRVHRSLRRFKGDCSFKTWLYKIVLNLSRNKYRWKKRRGEFAKAKGDPVEDRRVAEASSQGLSGDTGIEAHGGIVLFGHLQFARVCGRHDKIEIT